MVAVEVVVSEAGVVVVAQLATDMQAKTGAPIMGGKEWLEQVFLGIHFKGLSLILKVDAVVMNTDGEGAALAVAQGIAAQVPAYLLQVFGVKMDGFVMGADNV